MIENLALEEKLKPEHTALVVVDVQNAFCHPQGIRSRQSDSGQSAAIMESMRSNLLFLLDSARRAGSLRIFVRAIHDLVYVSPVYAEQMRKQGTLGGITRDSWDADYWGDEIRPNLGPREVEILKHRYSAFRGTDLDVVLRSNSIKTLVMTGVATGGCVISTAIDGFFEDYYVVMASDAMADRDKQVQEMLLRRFGQAFGDVLSSSEIVEIWSTAAARLGVL